MHNNFSKTFNTIVFPEISSTQSETFDIFPKLRIFVFVLIIFRLSFTNSLELLRNDTNVKISFSNWKLTEELHLAKATQVIAGQSPPPQIWKLRAY